jgi:hypothetical protein
MDNQRRLWRIDVRERLAKAFSDDLRCMEDDGSRLLNTDRHRQR